MKGIVFNLLNELVEKEFSTEVWDKLLCEIDLESKGAYTAAGTYHDQELFSIVGKLSEISGVAVPDLVKTFGRFAFNKLARLYPVFLKGHHAKSFLLSVHDVIHVEVKKLYPSAVLPTIKYEDYEKHELIMLYHSPRKLIEFALGLIDGVSEHFEIEIDYQVQEEMIDGESWYRIHLWFNHE